MRLRTIAVVGFAGCLVAPAFAQRAEDIVHWTAKAPAAAVKPGGTATIQLTAEITTGWHMYALTQVDGGPTPLEISLAKRQPFTLDAQRIDAPLPAVTKGAGGEPDTFQYDDKVTFSLPVTAPKTMKPGKHTVSVEAAYQVCSGSICLRRTTATVSVPITVAK